MSEEQRKASRHGTSPCFLLFLLFLGLKLAGILDWSWWWVFSPYWVPLVAIGVCLGAFGLLGFLTEWLGGKGK